MLIENKYNEKHKEFEDNKGVIRNCKLKKDTQHNVQKKKDNSFMTYHRVCNKTGCH
jgi:hypothetical protein